MNAFRTEFKTEMVKNIPSLTPDQIAEVLGVFDTLTYNKYDMVAKTTALVVSTGYNQHVIDQYIASFYTRRKANDTARNTRYKIERFLETVGKDADKVDTTDVLNFFLMYRAKGGKRLKASSQNQYEQVIDCFYKWCVKNSKITHITENPMDCYEKATVPTERRGALTEDELTAFINSCKTERERLLIEFLVQTGCRVAEMCNATRDNLRVDMEKDGEVPFLIQGKGNKADTYFITRDLYDRIAEYWETTGVVGCIFGNEVNRPITPDATRDMIHRIQTASGIDRLVITPHTFRHTTATLLVAKGGSAYDVRLMLNHSSTAVSERYIDDDIERRRSVARLAPLRA